MEQRFLEEACRIGDDLLGRAIIDKDGYTWKVMSTSSGGRIQWGTSDNLYSGTAGIVYFFLELYKSTKEPKYLEAVRNGTTWLEKYCNENKTDYYAFYTGRMGVSYLMLQLAEVFDDEAYKGKALSIAEGCASFLKSRMQIDDLINGSSGTLLGLLHLHAATGDESVLENIKLYISHLIGRANFGKRGLYWDRSPNNINGLCGFSHGASGIGYVFLELGQYFQNETFYFIAEQAFAYENDLYNTDFGNWPDLRKGAFDEKTLNEHKEEYRKNNKDFFFSLGNMSAWCHGAPGIGLSRVRAFQLLGKDQYRVDLERAINKTEEVGKKYNPLSVSYNLCHGAGGNSLLFLEADRILPDTKVSELIKAVADNGLKFKSKYDNYLSGYSFAGPQSDTSLFMGDAGIGYFYLLAAASELEKSSILKPDVTGSFQGEKSGVLNMNFSDLFDQLAHKLYPQTTEYLKNNELLQHPVNYLGEALAVEISGIIEDAVTAKNLDALNSLFTYEKLKNSLDSSLDNHAFRHIKRTVEIERNQELLHDEAALLKTMISLPHEHKLVEAPDLTKVTGGEDNDEDYIILIPVFDGIREFPLNDFSYAVLQKFETSQTIDKAINTLIDDFDIKIEEEIAQVKDATLNQIKEALKQGILVEDTGVNANI